MPIEKEFCIECGKEVDKKKMHGEHSGLDGTRRFLFHIKCIDKLTSEQFLAKITLLSSKQNA